MRVLQTTFLVVFSSALVLSSALYLAWENAVGIDTAASFAKSAAGAVLIITSTLAVIMAGDKSFFQTSALKWLRNVGLQRLPLLILANIISILLLITPIYYWLNYREVRVFSDQTVILKNASDLLDPSELGLLPSNVERVVLIPVGEFRLGWRPIGMNAVGVNPRSIVVPPRGQAFGQLLIINTEDMSDVVAPIRAKN